MCGPRRGKYFPPLLVYAIQGLITGTPLASKSATFRVTTLAPFTRAMAVIELVDRDPAAKGQDSGPRPGDSDEAEAAA